MTYYYKPMQRETLKNRKKIRILNIPFSNTNFENILKKMEISINNRNIGDYISITNTESMYHALRIQSHYEYIKKARFSCCDGVGVVIAGKLFGLDIPRLHGPDLMTKSFQYGIKRRWRHYFYGGKKGVPEILRKKMSKKYPGLITAGTYSPPFRELTKKEDKYIIEDINNASPDILWVGLGLLKQEKWIADHLGKINVPWMIGVGAAFDFNAGIIRRAPKFFRVTGLEWLFRLTLEPRMFIRNLYSLFLLIEIIQKRGNIKIKEDKFNA